MPTTYISVEKLEKYLFFNYVPKVILRPVLHKINIISNNLSSVLFRIFFIHFLSNIKTVKMVLMLWRVKFVCFCFEALQPSQQFFSHDRAISCQVMLG